MAIWFNEENIRLGYSVRFLLNVPARTHTDAHEFSLVCQLPVGLRVKQLKLNSVHYIVNRNSPSYLTPSFNLTRNRHIINARSSTIFLQVPTIKAFDKTSVGMS